MTLKLSILEQAQVSENQSIKETFDYTVKLAEQADKLGFERFWVAEHHGSDKLVSSSPEILMAHLAAKTERIRIGSGGIMLPHYSAYKVAENVRLLELMHPGRIDVGLGRAPGGNHLSNFALRDGSPRQYDPFAEQIKDLRLYLKGELPRSHQYAGLIAAPDIKEKPAMWMLGSSPHSAVLAAQEGLPYMYAQFISGNQTIGTQAAQMYHENFNSESGEVSQAENAVSIFFACGETEEEAERIASSFDLAMLMLETGQSGLGTPSPETVRNYRFSASDQARIKENRSRIIVGTKESAREQIEALAHAYGAKEVMLAMITHDYEDKLKSYRLIAEAMLA